MQSRVSRPAVQVKAGRAVALDKTGWKVIDAKRAEVGMASIALSKPDNASQFLNCQIEHIEIAGSLGLGIFDDNKIQVKKFTL